MGVTSADGAGMHTCGESRGPRARRELGCHTTKGLCFFSFIFISWRLITLQYCSGFCHILTF